MAFAKIMTHTSIIDNNSVFDQGKQLSEVSSIISLPVKKYDPETN